MKLSGRAIMLDLAPSRATAGLHTCSYFLRRDRPAKRLWADSTPVRRAEKRQRCNTAAASLHSSSRHHARPTAAAEQPVIDVTLEEDHRQQQGALITDLEGYHVIQLEGCEFLIAMSPDGQLDLQDVYVQDKEQGMSGRPDVAGEVPEQAQLYQEVEWAQLDTGDTLKSKPRRKIVQRVYLIAIAATEPYHMLDLERVWCLDAKSRSLAQREVLRATEDTNPGDLQLRIMRDGQLVLDSVTSMPPLEAVVDEFESGKAQGASQQPADEGVAQDPITRLDDRDEDFDQPDLPESDM